VRTTSTDFEHFSDDDELWLSDLETRAIDLEQELAEWREARQRAVAEDADSPDAPPAPPAASFRGYGGQPRPDKRARSVSTGRTPPRPTGRPQPPRAAGRQQWPDERTKALIDHGRRSVHRVGLSRRRTIIVGIAIAAVLIFVLVKVVFRQGASWPASVATVQSEIDTACQNPNVESEPDQINFACDKTTSQILWVFALMTSNDNPNFADSKSGRKGLEPITAAQGGDVAWSLNLHHPYDPYNPIDSLEVGARAINNIIGGATVTNSSGETVVQPGLESNPANCARYTGSSAVITRGGFPDVCAQPVTSGAGQAALVADVYQQWLVGASQAAAQDASILFENANNPGSPQVQAILKSLSSEAS
jgi:hypothetical protein